MKNFEEMKKLSVTLLKSHGGILEEKTKNKKLSLQLLVISFALSVSKLPPYVCGISHYANFGGINVSIFDSLEGGFCAQKSYSEDNLLEKKI